MPHAHVQLTQVKKSRLNQSSMLTTRASTSDRGADSPMSRLSCAASAAAARIAASGIAARAAACASTSSYCAPPRAPEINHGVTQLCAQPHSRAAACVKTSLLPRWSKSGPDQLSRRTAFSMARTCAAYRSCHRCQPLLAADILDLSWLLTGEGVSWRAHAEGAVDARVDGGLEAPLPLPLLLSVRPG